MNPDRYLRTFDILTLLVNHKDGLRLTEIKDVLGLPVSSVHNVLQTMVSADVVVVDDDLRYSVGPRTVALALRTVQSLDVRSLARRPLQDLAREIGDDVYLGLRLGKRVIYADRILGTQRISLDIRLGEALHLHSTATGKLFAAFDDRLAAQALTDKLPKITPPCRSAMPPARWPRRCTFRCWLPAPPRRMRKSCWRPPVPAPSRSSGCWATFATRPSSRKKRPHAAAPERCTRAPLQSDELGNTPRASRSDRCARVFPLSRCAATHDTLGSPDAPGHCHAGMSAYAWTGDANRHPCYSKFRKHVLYFVI